MPELPEVEVLVRHLRPLIRAETIRAINVRREKSLWPTAAKEFQKKLLGAKFKELSRRGKYLLFELQPKSSREKFGVLGHLGMTGRMYVVSKKEKLPKHAAVIFDLGARNFIYEDYRYFGRMSLDLSPVDKLGPEPLNKKFSPKFLAAALKHSRQPIKVKLLDQTVAAGVGNIYASEALFRAKISPELPANKLSEAQIEKLWRAIRETLRSAIHFGSTVPLKFASGKSDGLFYFGHSGDNENFYRERLLAYDRAGKPCFNCGTKVQRIMQAARSTFFCPQCQKT